ncbi:MAG: hypothetical protein U0M12_08785 [Acutalibacteraceae bacterium]|nr:hypothetical protein [Acutalibacteraceae bacterium]
MSDFFGGIFDFNNSKGHSEQTVEFVYFSEMMNYFDENDYEDYDDLDDYDDDYDEYEGF